MMRTPLYAYFVWTTLFCLVVFGSARSHAETILERGEIKTVVSPDDLHLDPTSVIVAVDVFGDEDREVNGILFQTDKTEDLAVGLVERDDVRVDILASNFIDGWAAAPSFSGGEGNSAANLSEIMSDIRWNPAPGAVTVDVSGLDAGGLYEVQILVNEGADRDRRWDVGVNGILAVDDFSSEGTGEDDDIWAPDNSFVYVGEFEATGEGEINVVMQQNIEGGQDPRGSDNNPILQAFILHTLNTSDDDPNLLTSSASKFGQVPATPAKVREIQIRNTGPTKALTLSQAEITGPDADHFQLISDLPVTVPADTRVEGDPEPKATLQVQFDAKGESGAFLASLVLTSDDEGEATQTVELTANVINLLGPLAHLKLDEPAGATELRDASGNENTGVVLTTAGTATLGQDPGLASGTGIEVAGGGEVAIAGGRIDPLESFSISLWMQIDSPIPSLGTIFAKGLADTPAFALLGQGTTLAWLTESAGESPEFLVDDVLQLGQAHHIVVVHDNTVGARSVTVYVDGEEVAKENDPLAIVDDKELGFQFGSYNGGLPVDAQLDDLQIYDRAISPEDVVELRDNPGGALPFDGKVDSDGDRLTDDRELELGTDSLKVDTDEDGLDDYEEVEIYQTNPLVVDTDEDGTEDADEVAQGMDPNDWSDGDLDRDGLPNGQEVELGTNPELRDTDGDIYSDGEEVATGSDPLDPNDPGVGEWGLIPTQVLTGKLAEDTIGELVIHGTFTHGVNIGETEEDVQVGDITFFKDTPAPENIEFAAQNHIEDWGAANNFGDDPDAEGLAQVASGIRWSAAPEGVQVTLKDVPRGAYRLQMIFGEKCCNRGFVVTVNGEVLDTMYSPNALQEADHGGASAAYFIYEFNQLEDGAVEIDLNGADADFPDRNAILSGVSLQWIQPLDAPVGPIEERVVGGKLAEDTLGELVIHGTFTHAVNVAETDEDVQVGDITFFRDTPAPDNIEIRAQNHIENWGAANNFGAGPDAEGLAKVASGIRWSGAPEGVGVTLKDVVPGAYRLQMIFGEKCCDRGFVVSVNGKVIDDMYSPNALQEGDHGGAAAGYLIYEFNQEEAGAVEIDLNGTDTEFPDKNAILSGVSLQFIRPLTDDNGGGGEADRIALGAVAISEGAQTEAGLVDFGDLSGDATYEFFFNAIKDGASTAITGNDAWAIKLDQWNEQGLFGTTQFGVADNLFEALEGQSVASVFGADVHVVIVNDTAGGETRLYIDGVHVGSWAGNFELAGIVNLMAARIETPVDFMGDGSVMFGWATYNSALGAEDIAALSTTPFPTTPPPTGRPFDIENVGIAESGAFTLTIPEGQTADIEYSVDLINWEVIATDASGTLEETDPDRLAAPSGYYRAR